jgi:hypothetical protein
MMGLTRKTINGYLSAFERDGLVRVTYGQIELRDIEGLRRIANS